MKGSKEIGFTVLSMSASLIAVFIPILLMGGLVGRLFREFAVTLSVAIAVSLPSRSPQPHALRTLPRAHKDRKHGSLYRHSERAFQWLRDEYSTACAGCFDTRFTLAGLLSVTFCSTGISTIIIPKGFFPQQDTGVSGLGARPQDISFMR